MSYSWREMIKRKKKELKEKLKLSEADWSFIQDNIGEFCRESDAQIRLIYGENCNVDKVVEGMTDYEFMQMSEEVIKTILEKLKYKKKKKKKQKQSEEQTEEQKANQDEEEQQEQEIECQKE